MSNFLYLFLSWRYPWRVKVGISTRPWGRRGEVARALGYTVGPYLPMFWAKPVEKAIHTVFSPLNTQTGLIPFGRIPDYSGSTEHFWIFNLISGLLTMIVAYTAGADQTTTNIIACTVLLCPLPFDIALCVVLYWIVEVFILHLILPYLSTIVTLVWFWLKYQLLTFLQL